MGTNFHFIKFCTEAKMLNVIYYQVFLKVYCSIEKIEKYYIPIHHTYNIIYTETQSIISKNIMLQIAFKAINDIIRLDGLIPTLFVFDIYFCMIIDLPY